MSSVATATNTIAAPEAAAGAVRRAVTRVNVTAGEVPSVADASSRPTGTWASPARTLTSARGMNIST